MDGCGREDTRLPPTLTHSRSLATMAATAPRAAHSRMKSVMRRNLARTQRIAGYAYPALHDHPTSISGPMSSEPELVEQLRQERAKSAALAAEVARLRETVGKLVSGGGLGSGWPEDGRLTPPFPPHSFALFLRDVTVCCASPRQVSGTEAEEEFLTNKVRLS